MLPQRKRIRLDRGVYFTPGYSFSIMIGASPRQDVFSDVAFGRACVGLLATEADRSAMDILAYCLMPDHVHMLVRLLGRTSLLSFVQAWKSRCYGESRRYGRITSFWQRSFFDHALRQDEDLSRIALYILANPVRKGLVEDFHHYPLCGSFAFDVSDDLI